MENTTQPTTKLEKIKTIIKKLNEDYDFNDYILNYLDESDIEEATNTDGLRKLFEKANENYEITDCQIIYYASAIKYLAENDNSLKESLGIASEYGYTINELNSELLASLLKSRNNQEDYTKFINEVIVEVENQDIFNDEPVTE